MDHYHHHHQYHQQVALHNNNNNNPYNSNFITPAPTRTATTSTRTAAGTATMLDQNKKMTRPQEPLNCPRCNSTNTKFCYYNNYSLSQPRYLCKTCRRYWTEGGSLRNVPVGGGSRKTKKLPQITTTTSSSSTSTANILPDLNPPFVFSSPSTSTQLQNPNKTHNIIDHHDLNLSFSGPMQHESRGQGQFGQFTDAMSSSSSGGQNCVFSPNTGMIRFHQDQYDDNKASLGFSLDGQDLEMGNNVVNGGGRLVFPYGDIKQLIPTTTKTGHEVEDHQKHDIDVANKRQGGSSNELWSGIILGGGPTW